MDKLLIRLSALALLPCLVVDTVTASSLRVGFDSRGAFRRADADHFTEQALASRAAHYPRRSYSPRLTAEILRQESFADRALDPLVLLPDEAEGYVQFMRAGRTEEAFNLATRRAPQMLVNTYFVVPIVQNAYSGDQRKAARLIWDLIEEVIEDFYAEANILNQTLRFATSEDHETLRRLFEKWVCPSELMVSLILRAAPDQIPDFKLGLQSVFAEVAQKIGQHNARVLEEAAEIKAEKKLALSILLPLVGALLWALLSSYAGPTVNLSLAGMAGGGVFTALFVTLAIGMAAGKLRHRDTLDDLRKSFAMTPAQVKIMMKRFQADLAAGSSPAAVQWATPHSEKLRTASDHYHAASYEHQELPTLHEEHLKRKDFRSALRKNLRGHLLGRRMRQAEHEIASILYMEAPDEEQSHFAPVLTALLQGLVAGTLPRTEEEWLANPIVLHSEKKCIENHFQVFDLKQLMFVAFDSAVHDVPLRQAHRKIVSAMWAAIDSVMVNYFNALPLLEREKFLDNTLTEIINAAGRSAHRDWNINSNNHFAAVQSNSGVEITDMPSRWKDRAVKVVTSLPHFVGALAFFRVTIWASETFADPTDQSRLIAMTVPFVLGLAFLIRGIKALHTMVNQNKRPRQNKQAVRIPALTRWTWARAWFILVSLCSLPLILPPIAQFLAAQVHVHHAVLDQMAARALGDKTFFLFLGFLLVFLSLDWWGGLRLVYAQGIRRAWTWSAMYQFLNSLEYHDSSPRIHAGLVPPLHAIHERIAWGLYRFERSVHWSEKFSSQQDERFMRDLQLLESLMDEAHNSEFGTPPLILLMRPETIAKLNRMFEDDELDFVAKYAARLKTLLEIPAGSKAAPRHRKPNNALSLPPAPGTPPGAHLLHSAA